MSTWGRLTSSVVLHWFSLGQALLDINVFSFTWDFEQLRQVSDKISWVKSSCNIKPTLKIDLFKANTQVVGVAACWQFPICYKWWRFWVQFTFDWKSFKSCFSCSLTVVSRCHWLCETRKCNKQAETAEIHEDLKPECLQWAGQAP